MARIQRIVADDGLMGTGAYSDALVVDLGEVHQVQLAGIAAVDHTDQSVVGYDAHSGTFAPDALERQVADVFAQAERLLAAAGEKLGRVVTVADITAALVFLREDYPKAFGRFNDAWVDEFSKRGIEQYPVRTTVTKVTLPEPAALVEIQFEAMVAK